MMVPERVSRETSLVRLLVAVFLTQRNANGTAMLIVRLMHRTAAQKGRFRRRFTTFLRRRLNRRFGCYVSPTARIGRNCVFPHPVGIVVGDGVVIGDDCVIYQNVTLGARTRGQEAEARYPVLEDGVVVYAGAVVIGPVRLGRGSRVAANAVVVADVPDGRVAAGVPAVVRA